MLQSTTVKNPKPMQTLASHDQIKRSKWNWHMAHAALSLCPHLHPVSMPDLLLTTMTSRLVADEALADKSWIS
jgi:hypothetical protein